MAVSGGIGKPGSITPLNPGLVDHDDLRAARRHVSATHCRTVRSCSRTARTATSNASAGGTPRRASAKPMVTGPTTCHLTGPRRPTAAARNPRRPPNGSWSDDQHHRGQRVETVDVDTDVPVLVDGDAATPTSP